MLSAHWPWSHRPRLHTATLVGALMIIASLGADSAQADDGELDFFESQVRPTLVDKCSGCHGPAKQEGGLRVDLLETLLTGGDSGPAVEPGDAANSLLAMAIRHEDGYEMPPKEVLSPQAIQALEHWINIGAPWPKSRESLTISTTRAADQAKNHWAFLPVEQPAVPRLAVLPEASDEEAWNRNPVDAFILEKLHAQSLTPSPRADRRSLIRRLSYSLTGLPPSPEDVEQFIEDTSPTAYADLVERLLASPQYGEHWARHWLDVARYADTKGYVYGREERFWVHAWTYRDWVVRALNEDMAYDRFLLLQLAADQVVDRRTSDLAAMGFLTVGRRFLGVERDIIDDRIDVVSRGTMGLTVACARCHDHKYDPIPTADYYSLYGVFNSCTERLEPLAAAQGDAAFQAELEKRQTALRERMATARQESTDRVRARIADYLYAQSELGKYPADGFDQIFQAGDILPAFVRRWQSYLRVAVRRDDPVFAAWHAYAALPTADFATAAQAVTDQLAQLPSVHAKVLQIFETSPHSFREVCDRYGAMFAAADKEWKAQHAADALAQQATSQPAEQAAAKSTSKSLSVQQVALKQTATGQAVDADDQADDTAEQLSALAAVLYGSQAPCEIPAGPIVLAERYFDSAVLTELWKLQGEVERWIINAPQPVPYALTLVDQAQPVEPRVFVRGNPLVLGDDVPRQFLAALSDSNSKPFEHGSGRYELAQAIIAADNPLTARVIVNRVWADHFGHGLVTTTSDFGTRAEPPSHPELLDWLAHNFVEHGWSLKELHRWIVLSATYQQSTRGPMDSSLVEAALEQDPDNRLLWRMNPRRLTFEEFRDSLITASSQLDKTVGGRPVNLFTSPYPLRRTLYGLVDRQFLPGTLRMFDFANPDLHISQRSETTVPGQALFFMNHPLLLDRARALAASTADRMDENPSDNPTVHTRARVDQMFQQVLQRGATASEIDEALSFVAGVTAGQSAPPSPTVDDWQYGYGKIDSDSASIVGFTALPYFSGTAWQGGASYPDPKLGWVQLSAAGGHPGNNLEHAAVRRWTAPRDGAFRIRSKLTHEPPVGDGIHASIVHSAQGILTSVALHHDALNIDHDDVQMSAGQTLDFVVDIGGGLNSDQFLWQINIEDQQMEQSEAAPAWNSLADFPSSQEHSLTAWEQLAQVLLCSNEFMFID